MTPQEFLNIFPDCHIQTFDDSKKVDDAPCRLYKGLEWSWLTEQNDKGFGIYFNPNPCLEGNRRRKEENITELKWAFVDMDIGTKAEMMEKVRSSPLKPSMIIESKRSYHLYFRADISKSKWSQIINGLIDFFDGDIALKSMNEVLRVPGFYHLKNPDSPFLIRIEEINAVKYTEQQLIDSFPHKPFEQTFKAQYGDKLEKVKNIPIKDVLQKLGADVRGNQIFEEGKQTSMQINISGNYVNRFSGKKGSGSTIDAAMYFKNIDVAEAIVWLKKEFGILDDSTWRGKPENNKAKDKASLVESSIEILEASNYIEEAKTYITSDRSPFTWGTQSLDNTFSPIERGHEIVLGGETGIGKTVFSFFMALQNARLGLRVLYISLEMSNLSLLTRYAREKAKIYMNEWKEKKIPEYKQKIFDEALGSVPKNLKLPKFNGNIERTTALVREFMAQNKYDIIFLDNLGFLDSEEGRTETEKQRFISRDLVDICRGANGVLVVIHHYRKGNSNLPRSLNDLMGSGKISHDTAYVVQVWRKRKIDEITEKEGYKKNENETKPIDPSELAVIVQKDRSWGREDSVIVHYHEGEFYDFLPKPEIIERMPWDSPIIEERKPEIEKSEEKENLYFPKNRDEIKKIFATPEEAEESLQRRREDHAKGVIDFDDLPDIEQPPQGLTKAEVLSVFPLATFP